MVKFSSAVGPSKSIPSRDYLGACINLTLLW